MKTKKRKASIIGLLSCVAALVVMVTGDVHAQKHNRKFDHITTLDGLSQNFVTCIFQDSKGFMWIGTSDDGLNKYDGYNFTVYRRNDDIKGALSHNQVQCISEDKEGYLWIGTGMGLNRFDRKKDKFITFKNDPDDPHSISDNSISAVLVDESDNLWIGIANGGLNYYDKKINRFRRFKEMSGIKVKAILEDEKRNLWITTSDWGLYKYDLEAKVFQQFRHDENDPQSLSSDKLSCIFLDSENNLWVGTQDAGLNLLNKDGESFSHFRSDLHKRNGLMSNRILSLAEDVHGNLWVGTENGGLSILEESISVFNNYTYDPCNSEGVNSQSIYSILRDVKGNMWLGTYTGGISFFDFNQNKFTHYKNNPSQAGLNNDVVYGITEDSKGRLLIGTNGGGLNTFDRESGTFSYIMHEPGNPASLCGNHVLSVLEDSDGFTWIGTWGDGVTMFNKEKNIFKHFKNDLSDSTSLSGNNAWALFEDRDKNIWIGTYWGGLSVYNKQTGKFRQYKDNKERSLGFKTNNINNIYQDREGNIWVVGFDGLALFDKVTETFSFYLNDPRDKRTLASNRVTAIIEDSFDNFWVGTHKGLCLFDKESKTFTTYGEKDGFSKELIKAMVEDDNGNLWISTIGGLSRFDIKTRKVKNYTTEDGLQIVQFTEHAHKTGDGMLYFSGTNGFIEFHPDSVDNTLYDPPIVLTDFQIFNKPVAVADSLHAESPLKTHITEADVINLSHDQSVVSITFASLSYTGRQTTRYSYMLEGFDKEWNDVGIQRSATYTNLEPGEYVFKVRGSTNQGEWSVKTAQVKLVVTPPFWDTWWFKVLSIFVVCMTIFVIYASRVSTIKKQKIELEAQVQKRTAELSKSSADLQKINNELDQFAYIVSHDLKAPLRAITNLSKWISEDLKTGSQEEVQKNMDLMEDRVERMQELINGILEYSRVGRIEAKYEPVAVSEVLKEVFEMLHIPEKFIVTVQEEMPTVLYNRVWLQQVFSNLISNAVKYHDKPQGKIVISYKESDGVHQFAVTDDGPGIEPAYHEKIFVIFQTLQSKGKESTGVGLAIVKKIIEEQGGAIWVESDGKSGSNFIFTIPKAAADHLRQ